MVGSVTSHNYGVSADRTRIMGQPVLAETSVSADGRTDKEIYELCSQKGKSLFNFRLPRLREKT